MKDRKVAGRTRATSKPTWPRPGPPAPQPANEPDEVAEDEDLAEVIPLDVFDARKEAQRWW